MRRMLLIPLALAMTLSACAQPSPDQPAGPAPAGQAAPTSAGADPATGSGGIVLGPDGGVGAQICAAFSREEIAALGGSPVQPGQVTGPLGSACSWDFETTGIVLVQVMTPEYWSAFRNQSDSRHQELPGIGNEAFVQPGLVSGWAAGALFDDRLVVTEVSGPTATSALASGVLRGVVGKLGRSRSDPK